MKVTLIPRPYTGDVSVIVHDGAGTIQAWRQPAYAPIPYEITAPWDVDDSGIWTTSVQHKPRLQSNTNWEYQ